MSLLVATLKCRGFCGKKNVCDCNFWSKKFCDSQSSQPAKKTGVQNFVTEKKFPFFIFFSVTLNGHKVQKKEVYKNCVTEPYWAFSKFWDFRLSMVWCTKKTRCTKIIEILIFSIILKKSFLCFLENFCVFWKISIFS